MLALTEILAVEADRLPEVSRFRSEVLGGELLAPSEVLKWVQDQAAKESSALCITLQLPPGVRVDVDGEGWRSVLRENLEQTHMVGVAATTLSCPAIPEPKSGTTNRKASESLVRPVPIRWGGVLGRLKSVAAILCNSYGWHEAEAVGYILTGCPPTIPLARSQVFHAPPFKQPTRIVMELSPQTKVEDAKQMFLELRKQALRGPVARFRRYRPLTKKRRALAVFLARTPGYSWQQRMDAWNEEFPTWQYTNRRNFRRDAISAYLRATGRVYRNPQGGSI